MLHQQCQHALQHLPVCSWAAQPSTCRCQQRQQQHVRLPALPEAKRQRTACQAARGAAMQAPQQLAAAGTLPLKRLAVFVSGSGSNFRAIHQQILDGVFEAEVAVCISNKASCGAWQYAESQGIPTLQWPQPSTHGPGAHSPDELLQALQETYRVDIAVLAGFMKLVPSNVVAAYRGAMLNIHPALLPAFGGRGLYGQRVHEAVIASGARFTGPTVHFVDEHYDTGPILAQRVVPVHPTDTPEKVAAKVLREEHKVYPEAVAAMVEGRISWRRDGVPIIWNPT